MRGQKFMYISIYICIYIHVYIHIYIYRYIASVVILHLGNRKVFAYSPAQSFSPRLDSEMNIRLYSLYVDFRISVFTRFYHCYLTNAGFACFCWEIGFEFSLGFGCLYKVSFWSGHQETYHTCRIESLYNVHVSVEIR